MPPTSARGAALAALEKYGAAAAHAGADRARWPTRTGRCGCARRRSSSELDPSRAGGGDRRAIRPAPTTVAAEVYSAAALTNPTVSTQVYIDTDRGTIQIELAVLDAPLTVGNFIGARAQGLLQRPQRAPRRARTSSSRTAIRAATAKARPGYTIRDELNERPYLRGTVGMALDLWPTPAAASGSSRIRRSRTSTRSIHGLRPRHRRHGRRRQDSSSGT